ncbi:hypothetical protein V5P93_003817 [Actinokineospora auranticolor]|uniref:Uncharacterized protein n=1 Tax=Actinokineospora auranticolor TaxID=155976 RepID=A0A2S6GLJ3_9PSEU|nr:hypothetical protein [Actinokineospora auranticolor]PPK66104.1 hypothetical protein CLV40_11168 [Actinokineospora auranticolor]
MRAGVRVVAALVLVPGLAPAPACVVGSITEYGRVASSLPVGGVCEVEFDHTGALRVEQYLSSQVARFDPATGQFTNYSTPMPLSFPVGVRTAADGTIRVAEALGMKIARVDAATGRITEYPLLGVNGLLTG